MSKPQIADHEVCALVARGSYGSVWLVRTVLGEYRAAKVLERRRFPSPERYEREWAGLREYEPISRRHTGLVHILQVGRCADDQWFYYLMEAADDVTGEGRIAPHSYAPRTLRAEMDRRGRFPVGACVAVGWALAGALASLHGEALVHRDLKPANVLYVRGTLKLGDIGTVSRHAPAGPSIGSVGYHPPEGSGLPSGDLFSLGRILYELFSGIPVQEAGENVPDLTPRLRGASEQAFYGVVRRCCHHEPEGRPATARDLQRELECMPLT